MPFGLPLVSVTFCNCDKGTFAFPSREAIPFALPLVSAIFCSCSKGTLVLESRVAMPFGLPTLFSTPLTLFST